MSHYTSQLQSQRERMSDNKRINRELEESPEEHDYNSFKGSSFNRKNEQTNYQKIPGKIRKQNVDATQTAESRRDSSSLNQQIKMGLQNVEPVINNQSQLQSGASSKSGSKEEAIGSNQSSPFRRAKHEQAQVQNNKGSFQKMYDQSNPMNKKSNPTASGISAGMKDMKQSKLFQKFLQQQQPAQAGNTKGTMSLANKGKAPNLDGSFSHDALRHAQNPSSSMISSGVNKGSGTNVKQQNMQGSFMGLAQNSFAQAGKNSQIGMHSTTSSITMLPSDLRNAKQLESFERFKKSQADKQSSIPSKTKSQKTSALLHAKNQQKLMKAQKDKKAVVKPAAKKKALGKSVAVDDVEDQIEMEFELRQKKLEDEQSAFVDHKKHMMRSPRNQAGPQPSFSMVSHNEDQQEYNDEDEE